MIASGDDRHARPQKFDRYFSGDAPAGGGIFAVYDYEIDRMLFLQFGQSPNNGIAPRLANDVAQKKDGKHSAILDRASRVVIPSRKDNASPARTEGSHIG
jgi:hypothetical protein